MTKLSIRSLLAANHAASKEEDRYYLQGVYTHINPKNELERVYVATDGRKLIRIIEAKEAGDSGEELIIPSSAIETLKKDGAAKQGHYVNLNFTGEWGEWAEFECISADSVSWKIAFKPIDGTYPPYEKVINLDDEIKPITSIGFSAAELATLAKAARVYKGISPKRTLASKLIFRGEYEPIEVAYFSNMTCILMPIRA